MKRYLALVAVLLIGCGKDAQQGATTQPVVPRFATVYTQAEDAFNSYVIAKDLRTEKCYAMYWAPYRLAMLGEVPCP